MRGGWKDGGKVLACLAAWLTALLLTSIASARERTCEVVLSTTQVDYGRLSRATLAVEANGMLSLPLRTVRLHVRCDEPGDMAVAFRGVPAEGNEFRFIDKGRFTLRLGNGLLDGTPVDLGLVGRGPGRPTQAGHSLAWHPDQALAPLTRGEVAWGREFSATIEIAAQIDEGSLIVGDAARWTTTGSVDVVAAGASRGLTLQADIQPGRCNVEVVQHLSFGRLRSTDLDSHGASTRVPATQSGRVRVLCDGPTPLALSVMRDERAGTVVAPAGLDASYPDGQLFGLGKTLAGENIGAYVVQWGASATSDRGELRVTHSIDGSRSWLPAGDVVMADHDIAQRVGYAFPRQATMGPLALKVLDVALDATIFIAPRSSLSLGDEINADGLMTIEIIY